MSNVTMKNASIVLVQVSPIHHLVYNNESASLGSNVKNGERQICAAPLVKYVLCSMSLQIIWDDDLDENSYSYYYDTPNQSRSRLHVRTGTAFIREQSDQGHINSKATIENIEILKKRLANEAEATKMLILPTVNLPSQDPSSNNNENGIPCLIRVYSGFHQKRESSYNSHNTLAETEITPSMDGALFQVLPSVAATAIHTKSRLCSIAFKNQSIPMNAIELNRVLTLEESLSGICKLNHGTKEIQHDAQVLSSFDSEIVRSLFLRMKALLSEPVTVGTTHYAKPFLSKNVKCKNKLHKAATEYWQSNTFHQNDLSRGDNRLKTSNFNRDGALTVYDYTHGSGKTALVKAIARSVLNCQAVHVISGSTLLSKFGANADIGLQYILHQIIISAAVQGYARNSVGSICIILDQLETFVPSGRTIDASAPALISNGRVSVNCLFIIEPLLS